MPEHDVHDSVVHHEHEEDLRPAKKIKTEGAPEMQPQSEEEEIAMMMEQMQNEWEVIPQQYERILNGFAAKFDELYTALFNELQSKVQLSNQEVGKLLEELHKHRVNNMQLSSKVKAIQKQTAFLHNSINGTEE